MTVSTSDNDLDLFNGGADADNQSALTASVVRGVVMRTVFESPLTGYSVLRVFSQTYGDMTMVGPLAGSNAGEEIEATGRWEKHKEHGRQFHVETFRFTLPTTEAGICRYLSSGVLKGVGPKTAQQIVDKFGTETMTVLSHQPHRLRELSGFGKKKLAQLCESWAGETARREVFVFLHGLGIGTATCQKLYGKYGGEAAEIVRENPYRLADDIHGIGFLSADRIAEQLGIGRESSVRIRAGILFAFKQLLIAGHTCYPRIHFIPYCAELLSLDSPLVEAVFQVMTDEKKVIEEQLPGMDEVMVYDSQMHRLERELVWYMRQVAAAPNHYARKMTGMDVLSRIEFSDEQLLAVERVAQSPLTVITGGPGVGKTTVIGEIVARARAQKMKIYLAAPTGRAAKRMSESTGQRCSTIHRLLKWQPESGGFEYGSKKKLPCHLLIVDEISMLDLPLAAYLFRAVQAGTSVVMVGDADQLPSVGPGRILHDLINSEICPVTHLSRIYRQKEASQIITSAHLVNEGKVPYADHRNPKSDFFWIEQDDPAVAVQTIVEMATQRIPARFGFNPMTDIQVLCPMNRGECGVIHINHALQSVLNPGEKPCIKLGERLLKVDDRVMQTVNNYELNVFNGDLGFVRAVGADGNHSLTVDFDGREVIYPIADAGQLVLAYAITVHKSQGSEFPCVIVPIMTQHYIMLQRNLLYTAITRAKKLLILIGPKKAVGMAAANVRQEPRYTTLAERLRDAVQ